MDDRKPLPLLKQYSGSELLEAYVEASGWANGATSTKSMAAWDKRRDELRAMLLVRLAS